MTWTFSPPQTKSHCRKQLDFHEIASRVFCSDCVRMVYAHFCYYLLRYCIKYTITIVRIRLYNVSATKYGRYSDRKNGKTHFRRSSNGNPSRTHCSIATAVTKALFSKRIVLFRHFPPVWIHAGRFLISHINVANSILFACLHLTYILIPLHFLSYTSHPLVLLSYKSNLSQALQLLKSFQ